MGKVNVTKAKNIVRRMNGNNPYGPLFRERMTPKAKMNFFLRTKVMAEMRDAEVNPMALKTRDQWVDADMIKTTAKDLGADIVGIAGYNPNIKYKDANEIDHKVVIVFGMAMKYDMMIDIGPESQEEVHNVYFALDELGVRLSQRIGAMGFNARTQGNTGDFPLPAYAQLAGLGELGKHGCLISPELGSSFRLSAITTDMPLQIDGPMDYGMDEVCVNCNICERFCPGEAILPMKREKAGVIRWHVDSDKCQPYFSKLYGCKICLSVCPLTAKVPNMRENYKKMAKVIKSTSNADGMIELLNDRNDLNMSAFDDIPYNPEDFGGKYIKEAREEQRQKKCDIKDSPIIYKGE